MYKVRSFLPVSALEMIYNSLFQSKLMYMLPLYSSANKSMMNRIFVLQKRALKTLYKHDIRHPTLDLFRHKAHKHLPLAALRTRSIATTVYKIKHDMILHNLQLPFVETGQMTRSISDQKLVVRRSRTKRYGDACFQNCGPRIYNALPMNIVQAASLPQMKTMMNLFLKDTPQLISSIE